MVVYGDDGGISFHLFSFPVYTVVVVLQSHTVPWQDGVACVTYSTYFKLQLSSSQNQFKFLKYSSKKQQTNKS